MADIVALRGRVSRQATGHSDHSGSARLTPRHDPHQSTGAATEDRVLTATGRRAVDLGAAVGRAATVTALTRTPGLAGLVRPATGRQGTVADDVDRVLPVLPELRPLLPGGGLRRGATVAVCPGQSIWPAGATSLLLALLAAASRGGAWCAVVGVPTLGALAAAEVGLDLRRLALVPDPGPEWPSVVAALLDGLDVVVAAPPGPIAPVVAGRLSARARQRGGVLVGYGGRWEGADVALESVRGVWQGLGQGRGRLRCRELTVTARGRGAAARPRQARIWLPGPTGTPAAAPAIVAPVADLPGEVAV